MSSWTSKCWVMHFIRTVCNTSTYVCMILSRLGCHEVFFMVRHSQTFRIYCPHPACLTSLSLFPTVPECTSFFCKHTVVIHFNAGIEIFFVSQRSETCHAGLKLFPQVYNSRGTTGSFCVMKHFLVCVCVWGRACRGLCLNGCSIKWSVELWLMHDYWGL